jgi:DivIVA domain-containing protein
MLSPKLVPRARSNRATAVRYDRVDVDALLRKIMPAVESADRFVRSQALETLRNVGFPLRLRGYDRAQVDDYLDRARASLAT